ncbi:hypothetical protein [Variovorax sp. PvP013]|uniref:hypothetical protein n=1 Tax=Variovorax sp. PvP013 TaxID=3156435 RepID=UPI003D211AE2
MARPRKPTNVHELRGTFKTHPERRAARANEPTPTGEIGAPPAHLSDAERACWIEVVGICHPGTLCNADRLIVEHAARVLNALRSRPLHLDVKLMVRLEAALGKLGLTPADRSKVPLLKSPTAGNPFSKFQPPTGH